MDLQDFNSETLYFEEDINPRVESLVGQAAMDYGETSETLLKQALLIEPENYLALIGLYRFYYYQNRYRDGIDVAKRVMTLVAKQVGFKANSWEDLTTEDLQNGTKNSFCRVRLYFFALKAAGYLHLRLGQFSHGKSMLMKVVEFDSNDRIGAQFLLDTLERNLAEVS